MVSIKSAQGNLLSMYLGKAGWLES